MSDQTGSQKDIDNLPNFFHVIHNRRSIRSFSQQEVPDDILEQIIQAGIRAPFAAQLYSIVFTRDSEKMKKLRGIYSTTQVLFVFFVDFTKIEKIIDLRGYTYDYDDGMLLWLGIQDAVLAAENIILAADALGLGSVLIGGAPLQADSIATLFNVPKRVFPIVALCLGYPDASVETDIRPRFPLKYIAFEDSYKDLSESEIQECMHQMDDGFITQGYYIKLRAKIPLKKGADSIDYDKYSWSEHQSRKYTQGMWSKERLFSIIKRYGFNYD
ncbi:MAG: nitroreductase family protein [Candidatus Hodarchaeota archaeon]